jgi:hypothetical protein
VAVGVVLAAAVALVARAVREVTPRQATVRGLGT